MNSRPHNFLTGLLMTALIGAAFVIHRHEEANYLAGGSYSAQENGRGGSSLADPLTPTAKITEGNAHSHAGFHP